MDLDLNPDGLMAGQDLQLDYAIEHLLKEIAAEPCDLPSPPPIRPRPLQLLR